MESFKQNIINLIKTSAGLTQQDMDLVAERAAKQMAITYLKEIGILITDENSVIVKLLPEIIKKEKGLKYYMHGIVYVTVLGKPKISFKFRFTPTDYMYPNVLEIDGKIYEFSPEGVEKYKSEQEQQSK